MRPTTILLNQPNSNVKKNAQVNGNQSNLNRRNSSQVNQQFIGPNTTENYKSKEALNKKTNELIIKNQSNNFSKTCLVC